MGLTSSFERKATNFWTNMTQVPVTDARSEKMKQTIAIIRFNSVQPSIANSFHIILESTLQNLKEGAVLKKTLFLKPSAAISIFDV